MLSKAIKYISILFSLTWIVAILTEYWHYNPAYGKAVRYFSYSGLLLTLMLLGSSMVWWVSRKRKQQQTLSIKGWNIVLLILFIDVITISFFYQKIPSINLDGKGLFSHLSQFIGVGLGTYLIYLICRLVGTLFTKVLPLNIVKENLPAIQIGIGIMIITSILFLLAVPHLLRWYTVIPLLIVILIWNWKLAFQVIQTDFIKPIRLPDKLNTIGIFSILMLTTFLVLDFVNLLRPFPFGTDAINLYVNLPVLIEEYGSLVKGYQPYNWSLFMSLGLLVFQSIEVVMTLSFLGGILSLVVFYRICRRWLDINYSFLCLALFFTVPMINFLSHMDMKIDLGLLYFSLCIILLFINWVDPRMSKPKKEKTIISKPKKGTAKKRNVSHNKTATNSLIAKAKHYFALNLPPILIENRLIVLMGIFTGFAFGVKLTALFLFFSLMAAIWYKEGSFRGFIIAFFLMLATSLILKFDQQAQLRDFHLSVNIVQWVLLAAGVAMLIFMVLKQQTKLIHLLKISLILTAFFVLPIIPWFVKNGMENESVHVDALLNGKKAMPELKINQIEKNWKDIYE